ncbi:MAG: hypothetical protein B0D91_13270 [Oceanospirillales bacterium LUC14_002_19_P2]|nr:MAG: hypothetical protein B0D91_13270 [Oceanospirillales bacterium LUC14_002_19_P2]
MKARSLSGRYWALGLGCIFSLFVSVSLSADIRLYRYNDENGQLVISTQVPLRYARSGYEVIDSKGKVLEAIEPELTGDALRARVQQQSREQQEKVARERRAQEGQELLKMYGSVDGVDRAKARQVAEMDAQIAIEQGSIQRLHVQREGKETRAAAIERSGRSVPEGLLQELAGIDAQVARHQDKIAKLEQEKSLLAEHYSEKRELVRQMLGEMSEVERNRELILTAQDLIGRWEPVNTGEAGVGYWHARDDGAFLLMKEQLEQEEQLLGRWSLDRTNRIVVVYHRRERQLDDGTRQSSPIGREERYQVLDRLENEDLLVRLDDQVVQLSRQ